MQKSSAQIQFHSGKEASTAIEHAESTMINGTGRQLTESQYFPIYTLPSSLSFQSMILCVYVCLVNVIFFSTKVNFVYFVL